MIYDSDAHFPYPILTRKSESYKDNDFIFDIIDINDEIKEDGEYYNFLITYKIPSKYLEKLLKINKAFLTCIIHTKDDENITLNYPSQKEILIHKDKISLVDKSQFQLFIVSNDIVSFENNNDLDFFYNSYKKNIILPRYTLLGYSNVIRFDGFDTDPEQLFEKRLDNTQKNNIQYILSSEKIVISSKYKEMLFNDLCDENLNNVYYYAGLQKSLLRFINTYSKEDTEEVYIQEIEVPDDKLDVKLHHLMNKNGVNLLNFDNIDYVITLITHDMLKDYSKAVRDMCTYEN